MGTAGAQMSGKPVKIGVLSDMSSLYADIGGAGSVAAAQMAVKDFGGKVNGVPIEVVSADHLEQARCRHQAIAQRWVDEDGVDAIVDVPTSSVALAVQDVMKEKQQGLPHLGRGVVRPHRQGMLAHGRPLDLRHLCAWRTAPARRW